MRGTPHEVDQPIRQSGAGKTAVIGDASASDASPIAPEAAQAMCVNLLAVRARTRAELATRLRRKAVPDDVADLVLDRLTRAGLIDDVDFANAFVSVRRRDRGLAGAELVRQLSAKGVDRAIALDAVSHLDSSSDHETARGIVRRRMAAMAHLDDAVKTRRLIGVLARKGYSSSTCHAVLREVLGEHVGQDIQDSCEG